MSEVKTKQSWEQFRATVPNFDELTKADIWNAALASVETTGRFEVGDECEIESVPGCWEPARIQAVAKTARNYTYQSLYVRPLPKAVDLTVQEKLHDLLSHVCYPSGGHDLTLGEGQQALLVMLASGKSLDDLCREYSVPLTKEV